MDADIFTSGRIIVRWFLVALSVSSVTFMFYYFSCCFSKKKWCRIALVGIMLSICIAIYVLSHRPAKVIRIQEDVIYIKPISR